MERNVKADPDYLDGCYIITHEAGTTALGFDNAIQQIRRIEVELIGRGALNETGTLKVERGSLATYHTLMNLRDLLHRTVKADGDQAACDLSPQLTGLEGHRVEVTRRGETRRFVVGKSMGWLPCHLELARRNSRDGIPAALEYDRVEDLGRVR